MPPYDSSTNSKYAPLHSDVELNDVSFNEAAGHVHEVHTGTSSVKTSRIPIRPEDLRQGWRFGASLGFLTCLFVLLLNLILTIWASTRGRSNDGHIYKGSCEAAKRYNMGLHVVINVLSTLLLGASNYSMQCLSAPTRKIIDQAHQNGRWVEIGVQSLKNLRWAVTWKKVVWGLLALSSLPLHLLYNSMFYSTISNNDYDLYFANKDWLGGAWYDSFSLPASGTSRNVFDPVYNKTVSWTPVYSSDPASLLNSYRQDASSFQSLNPQACIDAYANTYVSDRRHVVLLSPWVNSSRDFPSAYVDEIQRVQENSSLHWVTFSSNEQLLYNKLDRYGWLCNNWDRGTPACTNDAAKEYAAQNWTIFGWPVSGCVSQKLPDSCSVNFHLGIAIVVILANFAKTVCIAAVCLFLADQPLLTTGDAIASFMRNPDATTTGCCLLDRNDILAQWYTMICSQKLLPPNAFFPQKQYRWRAVGWKSWLGFLLFFSVCLLIVAIFLSIGISAMADQGIYSFSSILALGFGTATAEMIINDWAIPITGSTALLQNVLVANTPQLLLSGVYLTLNNVLTRLQLAVEWASYSLRRKGLRVSHDRTGAQRATYFLQLPYRLGVPLMIISTVLHWLVSQSIFLVSIETYDVNGLPKEEEEHIATCGYSPLAIICLLIVSGVVVMFALVQGVKVLRSQGMPLVGSVSVGIAAACHPLKEAGDASQPLMWGVVSKDVEENEEYIGHCSFSSAAVEMPVEGQLYA
ncbi:hypothetical protein SVAN01_10743 [Stagonosporopsis vannaccii]|nr:hypothetical protein SVAN01_10743 [Stagonosporopsis vannaccii]